MNLNILIRHLDFRAICLFMGERGREVTANESYYPAISSNSGFTHSKWNKWNGKWKEEEAE
ncbi:MAG: hypothetical protein AAGC85_17655 [Bacteroidota bacterium]